MDKLVEVIDADARLHLRWANETDTNRPRETAADLVAAAALPHGTFQPMAQLKEDPARTWVWDSPDFDLCERESRKLALEDWGVHWDPTIRL